MSAGSIIRRGEAWSLAIEQPRRPDGRRRKKWYTVRGTKRQAEARLAEILHEMNEGNLEPSPMPLSAFLDQWLAQTGGSLSARTRERYASIIAHHLKPALGERPLRALTPLQIQSYYSEALGDAGLSPATVRKHHHILRKALGLSLIHI